MRRGVLRPSRVPQRPDAGFSWSDASIRRFSILLGVVFCALFLPSGAFAAQPRTITGAVTAISPSSLTIQTNGRRTGVINALTEAADAITKDDYAYVWGGGHAQAGVASIGIKGPGYNGHRVGYDCSGSVAAVLAGAGLWPAGSPVPSDAGIITQLLQERLIARGVGQAPDEVTLYDDPGVHIFMSIDGRFFGTSDGGAGNSKGGPTWLADGAPDASDRVYKRYHLLPSVLQDQTTYGQSFSFQLSPSAVGIDDYAIGDDLKVSYVEAGSGAMIARTIGFVGAITISGTVTSIAPDESSFVVETAAGQSLTLSTDDFTDLISGVQVGDQVQVVYTKMAQGSLTAHSVLITTTPGISEASGTIVAIAPRLASFTILTTSGADMTFDTGALEGIIANLQVGDGVQVSYTQAPDGVLTAQQVADTGTTTGGRTP